jgi:lambda repressor-like predicted transcriptional regulator
MEHLSLAEAARQAGLAPVTLRKALATGKLRAIKQAGRWFTS